MEQYPLLPLTNGVASCPIVTRMFELLSDEQHYDFAVIGYLFAARTFELLKQESNLAWLKERGRHMDDFLSESPAYQWILDKGEAQGVAQMRQTIVDFVRDDFPEASPTSRRSSGNHRQSATARASQHQTRWCPECRTST